MVAGQTKTLRFRVRDRHAARLRRQAAAVNAVWNFCNGTQRTAVVRGARWPSHFDFVLLTAGSCRELGLSSGTISEVCRQYVLSRRTRGRRQLRWRGHRALGWVPARGRDIRPTSAGVRFGGVEYSAWMSQPIVGRILDRSGFSADTRGRWYANLTVEVPIQPPRQTTRSVGIDLGLKSFATLSDGETVSAPQCLRRSADRLALAQRSGSKRRTRDIHAKIVNQRRDFHHKLSARLVRDFDLIAVGDVSARALSRTKLAKSVHDAGWSQFRKMLSYKAIAQGATYKEVREHLTTQTCSDCGFVGGPKGRKGLVIREWTCTQCGSIHDRDTNAARNILGLGHEPPAEGIRASHGRRVSTISIAYSVPG